MIDYTFVAYPWLAIGLWMATYTADYYLTLYTARLYRDHVAAHMQFGGSFELTPAYQRDVDQLRPLSPMFVTVLLAGSAALGLFWWASITILGWTWPIALLAGGLLLRQGAILIRHARNAAMYRAVSRPLGPGPALEGQLRLARWLVLKQSAAELFAFAVLFLGLAFLSGSAFLAGGALGCAVVSWQHRGLSRRAAAAAPAPA